MVNSRSVQMTVQETRKDRKCEFGLEETVRTPCDGAPISLRPRVKLSAHSKSDAVVGPGLAAAVARLSNQVVEHLAEQLDSSVHSFWTRLEEWSY